MSGLFEKMRPFKLSMEDKSPVGPAFWQIPLDNVTKAEAEAYPGYMGVEVCSGNEVHVFQLPAEDLSKVQAIYGNNTRPQERKV